MSYVSRNLRFFRQSNLSVLTLLLVGGRIAPPASFSALYGKRLKIGTWNFLTFPIHSLGMLYQIFEFLLCAEAPPGPLSRGHGCQVSDNFFLKFSETVKIWLCVMDWFIEKLVLKFGRNRSRNNEVMTILNIWWKKRRILFLAPWTPNFRIFWIFENGSCSSRWGKSNGVYPIEIGLTVLEISRGAESAPLTS